MKRKACVMDDKICTDCGECDYCDLDKTKICDNCCECLELPDYNGVMIDDILDHVEIPRKRVFRPVKN